MDSPSTTMISYWSRGKSWFNIASNKFSKYFSSLRTTSRNEKIGFSSMVDHFSLLHFKAVNPSVVPMITRTRCYDNSFIHQ